MKFIYIIIATLFASFAYLQLNDPDPWLWTSLYIFVAVIAVLAALNKFPIWIIRGGIIVGLIGILMLLPDFINWIRTGAESITQSMKAEKPHIELTREFLGLLLFLLTLSFVHGQAQKEK